MVALDNIWNYYIKPISIARNRKSLIRIGKDLTRFYMVHRCRPTDYFKLSLYMNYIEDDILDYIPKQKIREFQIRMNKVRSHQISKDKIACANLLRDRGVRSVQELFHFDPGRGFFDPTDHVLSDAQAVDIITANGGRAFAKPVDGSNGNGAQIIDATESSLARIRTATTPMLFQPVIQQHPAVSALNASTINSVRIETLLTDHGVISNVAILRVGRSGRIIDNASAGGMAVLVDIQTGRLGNHARTKSAFSTERLDRHPDSGIPFGTVTIPFWPEVLDLVRRGAEAIPQIRTIGWDVAITPDGPLIIESNAYWNPEVFQLCIPLGKTGLAPYVMDKSFKAS